MEPMCRLSAILMALGLLSAAVGCEHWKGEHVHGVCDCDQMPTTYGTPYVSGPGAAVRIEPVAKPEPVKLMPKPDK